MSNPVSWIQHKGKNILFCNFYKFSENQYVEGVDTMEKELLALPQGSRPLLIIDVTESNMTIKSSGRGKQCIDALTKANIVTKTAMIGLTGLKKIITQALSKDVYCAKDIDDAKEWIIAQ